MASAPQPFGRCTAAGASIVIADVDEAGAALADELGGAFIRTDVSRREDNAAMVAFAFERFGGLDLVHLNAGVASGMGVGEEFDLERYRMIMGVNLDGVIFGTVEALAAMRERGTGGAIVATASLAGLTAVPYDPLYAANKHAVVGLARSLGPALAGEGIRLQRDLPGLLGVGDHRLVPAGARGLEPADHSRRAGRRRRASSSSAAR